MASKADGTVFASKAAALSKPCCALPFGARKGTDALTTCIAVCTSIEGVTPSHDRRHSSNCCTKTGSWQEQYVDTRSEVQWAITILYGPHSQMAGDD
eukprot:1442439-Prymnesium_polylepis.1